MKINRIVGLLLSLLFLAAFQEDQASKKRTVTISIGEDALPMLSQYVDHVRLINTNKSNKGITLVEVPEESLSLISEMMHSKFRRCGGYMYEPDSVNALLDWDKSSENNKMLENIDYSIKHDKVVPELILQANELKIRNTILKLSSYRNRYYKSEHGVSSQKWVFETWKNLTANNPNVSVRLIEHSSYPQPSVELTWTGKNNPEEILVLGGHGDSIAGWYPPSNVDAPGADDNASGIAVITEVIRVLAANNFQANRTIKFYSYAAEEVGLRGSQDIANQHKAENANVMGVMQLDMTNFSGSAEDIVLISDFTNAQQNQYLTELMSHYMPNISWRESKCGYACSDHASWTRKGYPASFPFEATMDDHNGKIHTRNDTISQSDNNATHALPFAQLAIAYLVELGLK